MTIRRVILAGGMTAAIAIGAALGASVGGSGASAQSGDGARAERMAKAAQILEFALPPDRFVSVLGAMAPELERSLAAEAERQGKSLPGDAGARFAVIFEEEAIALTEALRVAVLPLYADALTTAELDALLALYGSREGRSLLEKMPMISAAIAEAAQEDVLRFAQVVEQRAVTEILGD